MRIEDLRFFNLTSEILHQKQRQMDTHSLLLRLRRQDIAYFKFIIESYEGMAVIRTRDPREAVVEVMVAPGWESAAEEVLEALRQEMDLETLPSFLPSSPRDSA